VKLTAGPHEPVPSLGDFVEIAGEGYKASSRISTADGGAMVSLRRLEYSEQEQQDTVDKQERSWAAQVLGDVLE